MGHDRKMGHVQSPKVYLGILAALGVLTILTVWISYYDLGQWNDVVALLVASCKATLVVLFFMHGRFEGKLIWAFIWYPLVIVGILLGGVFLDYVNRTSSMQQVLTPASITESAHHGDDHAAPAGDAHAAPVGNHGEDKAHDGEAKEGEPAADGEHDNSGDH